jgi:methylated-DNA-[protein]-cysteine S-methyltransferase
MAFLNNYFAGRPDVIRPPLDPPALPPFTKKVWRCIRRIPWGHMRTYGDIAGRLSSPRAARAVGNACAANPLPILVPCHRVVGKGELGGFAAGRRWKRFLLAHESRIRPPVSRRGGRIFA